MKMTTLCYLERGEEYLLLHRVSKEKDPNQEKWIGVGGKFEENESPEECLLREVKEETGYRLTSYRLRGIVTFVSDTWEGEYMFLYTADGFEGKEIPCREGVLEWTDKTAMLQYNLWEGDKIFLKLLKDDAPFFSLKLTYEGDVLVDAVLNGEAIRELPHSAR